MTILCTRCTLPSPTEDFQNEHGKTCTTCRTCRTARRDESRRRRVRIGAAGRRNDNLRQKYGISAEKYDALRAQQDHRCAICGIHENEITYGPVGRPRLDGAATAAPSRLLVDHCHNSATVRGLLCHHCNAGIGAFKDSPMLLDAAMRYVQGGVVPTGL